MENQKNNPSSDGEIPPIVGQVTVTSRGVGYLPNDLFEEDIEIPNDYINTALNKDFVEVLLHPKVAGERIKGEVVKITERAKQQFVGTIEKCDDGAIFLAPDDKRMYMDILLPGAEVENEMKVVVELTHWSDPKKNPEGKILQILGKKGEHNVEMQSIVLEHGFEIELPTEIEKVAKEIENKKAQIIREEEDKISNNIPGKRRDFRNVITMTIDPPDAKDFDDALSIKKLDTGNFEVGVHIADVSHYVTLGSAIDKEAQKRTTSIYLVDRTIPMLPEIISNDVSSLNPNEDKLAFSAVFTLSPEGTVLDKWFGETLINSNKRFTYENAQKTIDSGSGDYCEELIILDTLAKKIREQRFKNGSISFEHDEVKFTLDENGTPIAVERKQIFDTNHLVEEYMLLANREVAEYIYDLTVKSGSKNSLFVYRIHDKPDEDRVKDLELFLTAIGYDFKIGDSGVTTHDFNNLFKQLEGKPVEELIKIAAIRTMSKAVYSTKNIGHFGLAFKYYTHFTSPIRRYPDLIVHRITKSYLNEKPLSDEELNLYAKLTTVSSEQEAEATKAERDSIRYKQVEYMKEHIGEIFEGTISGVTDFGIFVEDTNTKAEGLIHVSKIGNDFYTLDKKTYSIKGERSGKSYSLGDKVKIKLTGADLDNKTLDFVFV